MAVQTQPRLTPEDYLAIERSADYKSEYLDGEVFAMGGASAQHSLITGNIVRELSTQLKRRPCRVYPNDLRVKVSPTGLYTYPDIVVVCGEPKFDDSQKDTLLNPTVIIEVLSDSTEAYDRGEKFQHYRKLESLSEYVLIAQKQHRVESYLRQPDECWLLTEISDPQGSIRLGSIDCALALAEVYDKVVE